MGSNQMTDAQLITTFASAIQRVFEMMLGLQVEVGSPETSSAAVPSHDVSGLIGFSGEATGAVVLCFPTEVACRIASSFAGEELTPDNPDFADAIGELANMVAGSAKTDIKGHRINISLPSVVVGSGHTISSLKDVSRHVLPCRTEFGSIVVEIGIKLNAACAAANS